jgi:hypothetical protein
MSKKISFLPNFNNKITSVAVEYAIQTQPNYLILLLSCYGNTACRTATIY